MPDCNNSFGPSLASQTTAMLLPGKLSGFQLSDRLYKKMLQEISLGTAGTALCIYCLSQDALKVLFKSVRTTLHYVIQMTAHMS